MSYRLEGKDIVLSGMQQGIAESPYDGIADMRNINTITIPGEGSVQFREIPATLPPVLNDIPFTADAATNRFTWAGPNTLYESAALRLDFDNDCEFIAVGGGGGGGGGDTGPNNGGGGGGAGDMKTGTFSPNPGVYPIVIGAGGGGGAGSAGGGASPGSDGVASSITDPNAVLISQANPGGGGGGVNATPPGENGRDGASGGGAAYTDGVPGNGAVGEGNDGGTWSTSGGGGGGGGGGGKTTVGGDAIGFAGGVGGTGLASSISGASVTYAAGGAGGDQGAGSATPGTANRGNGGGGGFGQMAGFNGAGGGSGVVIIRYPTGLVNGSGGSVTTSGGFTIHTFTTSGDFEITGSIATNTVYYARNVSGATFQISLAPGSSVVIDVTTSFTGTFTTYQYGNQRGLTASTTAICPVAYATDRNRENGQSNGLYFTDLSNYLWGIFPNALQIGSATLPANTLVFMGNIGGVGAADGIGTGLGIWEGYFTLFGSPGRLDLGNMNEIWFEGPVVGWIYAWWSSPDIRSINTRTPVLVGQDNVVYYCSGDGVGSILVNAGEFFDPTDSATYTRNNEALRLPSFDSSTCLAELGTNLLIGGENSFVYPWDRVSTSFTYPIVVPDSYIANIIGTNQNAYVFAGNRGRIYITNGSAIDLYKKIPDYITGIINPYYRWRDTSFSRNQLYFTFTVTTNADVAVQTVNGVWAINLANDALYMQNKITNTGYSGITSMATEMPTANIADQPSGTAIVLGWNVGGVYGIDVGSSLPYVGGEAFIEFDMIPIATLLNTFTPSQFEFKLSEPLGGNGTAETVRLLARQNLKDAFVEIGITTLSGPVTDVTVALSDVYQSNFEKAQWLQLRVELTSNNTTPTMVRFYEARLRDFEAI